MINRFVFLSAIFFSFNCYSDSFIQPIKQYDQDEILVNGASVLMSKKSQTVLMYQTSEKIKKNHANFFFTVKNETALPVNLYFENLVVTDQFGRHIPVVHKNHQIARKRKEAKNLSILSGVCTGLELLSSDSAGEVKYTETSVSHNRTGSSVTCREGTIHNEALRRQAVDEAVIGGAVRNHEINEEFRSWENGLSHYYFDSNTIFPNSSYSANFQIRVPSHYEQDLTYLTFTYTLNGEQHAFKYFCQPTGRRYGRR